MRKESEFINFEVTVRALTGKALCVECDDWETAQWIPISVCDFNFKPDIGESGTLYVAKWFVEKNGLE
jgi:hypothetical protein